MSKKKKIMIIALIVIILIVVIVAFFIIKSKKSSTPGMPDNMQFMGTENGERDMNKDFSKGEDGEADSNFNPKSKDGTDSSFSKSSEGGDSISESDSADLDGEDSNFKQKSDRSNKQNKTTLKSQTEVKSALTEDVELHATYYLEEVYVEENQFVSAGENILKYTNGTYLVAPYDCYIIKLNLPDLEGKALNSHYVEISSSNSLMVTMSIDETNINSVSVGTEATIEVTSLGKTYTGYVTNIASTGSNGKFQIEIEFENDGDVMIGMSSTVSITI
jgi:hypothetical protein